MNVLQVGISLHSTNIHASLLAERRKARTFDPQTHKPC